VARTLPRLLLVAIAALLACTGVMMNPTPAWACSCTPVTVQQAAENADAVFRGRVTQRDRAGRGDTARVELRFQVSRVFKGRVYADQVVTTAVDSAGCGIEAAVDSEWIIFAVEVSETSGDRVITHLQTSLCSGNLPGVNSPALLGRGQFPRPGASDTEEKSITTDVRVDRGLKIAGIVTLTLVIAAGVGLAVLWRPKQP
jgi:hypothetical protein